MKYLDDVTATDRIYKLHINRSTGKGQVQQSYDIIRVKEVIVLYSLFKVGIMIVYGLTGVPGFLNIFWECVYFRFVPFRHNLFPMTYQNT
jgi:hypothetical protein